MSKLSQNQKVTYNKCTLGIAISADAKSAFLDIRVAVRDLFINYDSDKTKYYDQISADMKIIEDLISQYGATVFDSEDQKNFDEMNAASMSIRS